MKTRVKSDLAKKVVAKVAKDAKDAKAARRRKSEMSTEMMQTLGAVAFAVVCLAIIGSTMFSSGSDTSARTAQRDTGKSIKVAAADDIDEHDTVRPRAKTEGLAAFVQSSLEEERHADRQRGNETEVATAPVAASAIVDDLDVPMVRQRGTPMVLDVPRRLERVPTAEHKKATSPAVAPVPADKPAVVAAVAAESTLPVAANKPTLPTAAVEDDDATPAPVAGHTPRDSAIAVDEPIVADSPATARPVQAAASTAAKTEPATSIPPLPVAQPATVAVVPPRAPQGFPPAPSPRLAEPRVELPDDPKPAVAQAPASAKPANVAAAPLPVAQPATVADVAPRVPQGFPPAPSPRLAEPRVELPDDPKPAVAQAPASAKPAQVAAAPLPVAQPPAVAVVPPRAPQGFPPAPSPRLAEPRVELPDDPKPAVAQAPASAKPANVAAAPLPVAQPATVADVAPRVPQGFPPAPSPRLAEPRVELPDDPKPAVAQAPASPKPAQVAAAPVPPPAAASARPVAAAKVAGAAKPSATPAPVAAISPPAAEDVAARAIPAPPQQPPQRDSATRVVLAPAVPVAPALSEPMAPVAAAKPAPVTQVETAPVAAVKPVEAPIAVVRPVEAPVAAVKPVEVPVAVVKPVEVPVAVVRPVEAPVAAVKPVEAPVAVVKPVEAPVAVVKPVEVPVAVAKPAEVPVAAVKPVEVPVAAVKPVEVPVAGAAKTLPAPAAAVAATPAETAASVTTTAPSVSAPAIPGAVAAGTPDAAAQPKSRWEEWSRDILAMFAPAKPAFQGAGDLKDCVDCPDLMIVPVGFFTMGADAADRDARPQERPSVRARITKSFAMGRTEVTVGEYRAFLAASNHAAPSCANFTTAPPTAPVTCVSHADALAYVKWLAGQTGERYRLPSASEWEYAAKAGRESTSIPVRVAALTGTTTDASAQANPFGFIGMGGSVAELVADCFTRSLAEAPTDGTAAVAEGGCRNRVVKDGSDAEPASFLRPSSRRAVAFDQRSEGVGFRVARDIATKNGARKR